MSLSWHEIYPAKIVSALLFRWSQMPTIRSLPIFSHPFPERFSIGTTLWCGWIQIRPVFSDLKILCASCRWAFVIFHRLKQFEHHMRRPTHPVKLDDLRGVENKTQEKGLKPQHQVTPLTWNPKKKWWCFGDRESPFAPKSHFSAETFIKTSQVYFGTISRWKIQPLDMSLEGWETFIQKDTMDWLLFAPIWVKPLLLSDVNSQCKEMPLFFFSEELEKQRSN